MYVAWFMLEPIGLFSAIMAYHSTAHVMDEPCKYLSMAPIASVAPDPPSSMTPAAIISSMGSSIIRYLQATRLYSGADALVRSIS
jgi:hypothetical protein